MDKYMGTKLLQEDKYKGTISKAQVYVLARPAASEVAPTPLTSSWLRRTGIVYPYVTGKPSSSEFHYTATPCVYNGGDVIPDLVEVRPTHTSARRAAPLSVRSARVAGKEDRRCAGNGPGIQRARWSKVTRSVAQAWPRASHETNARLPPPRHLEEGRQDYDHELQGRDQRPAATGGEEVLPGLSPVRSMAVCSRRMVHSFHTRGSTPRQPTPHTQ